MPVVDTGNRLLDAAVLDSAGPPAPERDVIPERLTHSELGQWLVIGEGPGGRPGV